MLRFFAQFFVKAGAKVDVLRMQIHVLNRYFDFKQLAYLGQALFSTAGFYSVMLHNSNRKTERRKSLRCLPVTLKKHCIKKCKGKLKLSAQGVKKMTEQTIAAEANKKPSGVQIAIHRIYGKNHKFEIKGMPVNLNTAGWNPKISLQANPRFTRLESGQHEIVLALQLTGEQSEQVGFQIYWEQAGLFTIKDAPAEQIETILYGVCPNMLFPYVGVSVNQMLSNAGFSPIYLAPLDFITLYRQHLQEQQQKQEQEKTQKASELQPA